MKRRNPKKKKKTSKKYLLCLKDKDGIVVDVIEHQSYDTLLMEGIDRAKEIKGSWQIYNPIKGSIIDEGRN